MKNLLLMVLCFGLVGCMVTPDMAAKRQLSFINYGKADYPPHENDYPIDLFFQGAPQKPYDVIGEVMGVVHHDKNLRPMLESKARQVGADGVIDIQTSMGMVSGTSVAQQGVWNSSGNMVGTMPVAQSFTARVINVQGKMIKYKLSQ